MSRGRQISVEVEEKVRELMGRGFGKAQVYGELKRVGMIDKGSSPSKSTIDRAFDRLKPKDPTGPWSLADADPDDARRVLDVLLFVFLYTEGRVWLSEGLADHVVRLRIASPTMPPDWAYYLARRYQSVASNEESRFLDLVVGLAPWTDEVGDPDFAPVPMWNHEILGTPPGIPMTPTQIFMDRLVRICAAGAGDAPKLHMPIDFEFQPDPRSLDLWVDPGAQPADILTSGRKGCFRIQRPLFHLGDEGEVDSD
jgi:hypothetical protein